MINRAQGTVEYLIIIAVVVVLSLIVVGLVITQVDNSSNVASTSEEISSKIGVNGLSLSSSVAGADTNGLLVLKNIGVENLTLKKIIVDGVDHNYDEYIVAGDEKGFKLKNVSACESGAKSKSYSVKVEYISASGLTKVSDFKTQVIDCTTIVIPTKTPVEEDRTLVWFDGNALSFDGSNDYIQLPFKQQSVPISFSIWVNPTSVDGWYTVVSNAIVNSAQSSAFAVRIWNTMVVLDVGNGELYTGYTISAGNWYHLVVVIESGSVKLYSNDSLVYSTTSYGTSSSKTDNFMIGKGFSYYYYGKIDEVLIFNRSLNQTEITDLYNSGNGLYVDTSITPFDSGLVAAYHFDEGSGIKAVDVLGDYNGTLVNGPAYVTGKVGHYN